MMVLSLWAIVRTVQLANSLRIVVWMRSSVSRSTAAVASSSTSILDLRNNARARHTSWRCPTLNTTKSTSLITTRCQRQAKFTGWSTFNFSDLHINWGSGPRLHRIFMELLFYQSTFWSHSTSGLSAIKECLGIVVEFLEAAWLPVNQPTASSHWAGPNMDINLQHV